MELYNNKENDSLTFKLNVEGIDVSNIEPRLIISNNENNYLFFGKIVENMCVFNIPKLDVYDKGDRGSIKFEIVSEDLYFNVWNDLFEVNSKATISLTDVTNESTYVSNKPSTPKISVAPVATKPKPAPKKVQKPKAVERKAQPIKESVTKKKTKDSGELVDFLTYLENHSD